MLFQRVSGRVWAIQEEANRLAAEVQRRDGVDLRVPGGPEFGPGDRRRDRFRGRWATPRPASRSGLRSGWNRWRPRAR